MLQSEISPEPGGGCFHNLKGHGPFSRLIHGRRKGSMGQHLAVSHWQLAKPQDPRTDDGAVIDENEQI
jgi:hypothetical protein